MVITLSTSINNIKSKLITNTRFQRTPSSFTNYDYLDFAIDGVKRFYVDTGLESSWDSEFTDGVLPTISRDLNIKEIDYCTIASEIKYFESVRNYWNTMVSYTTNALSVAYAYKPFEYFSKIIDDKEKKLTELFYKMTDYSNMSSVSDVTVDPVDYDFE
jgi:hypothetical protein